MRKRLFGIAGTILTLALLFFGGYGSPTVFAADESAMYIKGAKFISAVDGKTDEGKEIVVAMYEQKGNNIIYVNDGKNHAYAGYFTAEGYSSDVGYYQDIYVNDEPFIRFFKEGKNKYIITNEGDIFACEALDAYEMSQIMSYD